MAVVSDHSDGWWEVSPFAFLDLENDLIASGGPTPSEAKPVNPYPPRK
ncbi:hypothetical protein ACFFWD_11935 [Bradyrhizobium erythrophlei]